MLQLIIDVFSVKRLNSRVQSTDVVVDGQGGKVYVQVGEVRSHSLIER